MAAEHASILTYPLLGLVCGHAAESLVDCVDHVRGAQSATVEAATVETFHGLLSTSNRLKPDEDIAFGIGLGVETIDGSVPGDTFRLDLSLQVFDPVGSPCSILPEK